VIFFPIFAVAGAIGGTFIGLIGTGSSMFVLPTLIYLLPLLIAPRDLALHMAVGTCVPVMGVGAIVSAILYWRKRWFDAGMIKVMTPGYVIGTAVGAVVSHLLPGHVLQAYVAILLLIAAVDMLRPKAHQTEGKQTARNPWILGMGFFAIAVVVSIAGIASGLFAIPIMVRCGVPIKKAIGTSVIGANIYTLVGTIAYIAVGWHHPDLPSWSLGYIYLPAFLMMGIFCVAFTPLGVKLTHHISPVILKRIFAVLLIFASVDLLVSVFI